MPRHPPYALKNLNTQNDQTNRNREQETPKKRPLIQRCPRPLCSSQTTTGPTKTTPPSRSVALAPQSRGTDSSSVSSGPNSVSTSSMTPTRRSPPLAGRYLPGDTIDLVSSQCST